MQALIVVDVQNEFSPAGLRTADNHAAALAAIQRRVADARAAGQPIAWVQHFNRPEEEPAFVPGTWGAELSAEVVPQLHRDEERHFPKDVFGGFTFTGLEEWLRSHGVQRVLVMGFFTHMCVSTTSREALVRGFDVVIDPDATSTHAISHPLLGELTAEEVRRTALLQLADMGAVIERHSDVASAHPRMASTAV